MNPLGLDKLVGCDTAREKIDRVASASMQANKAGRLTFSSSNRRDDLLGGFPAKRFRPALVLDDGTCWHDNDRPFGLSLSLLLLLISPHSHEAGSPGDELVSLSRGSWTLFSVSVLRLQVRDHCLLTGGTFSVYLLVRLSLVGVVVVEEAHFCQCDIDRERACLWLVAEWILVATTRSKWYPCLEQPQVFIRTIIPTQPLSAA